MIFCGKDEIDEAPSVAAAGVDNAFAPTTAVGACANLEDPGSLNRFAAVVVDVVVVDVVDDDGFVGAISDVVSVDVGSAPATPADCGRTRL